MFMQLSTYDPTADVTAAATETGSLMGQTIISLVVAITVFVIAAWASRKVMAMIRGQYEL